MRALPLSTAFLAACAAAPKDQGWPCVGGDRGCMRYAALEQIHRGNVHELEVAWTWHTGELERGKQTIECTPLVVGRRLFLTTAFLRVVALDAGTGEELWSFDPLAGGTPYPIASGGVNRGLAYADGRIYHGCADGRVFCLDATSGALVPAFGEGGVLDLRAGLEGDLSRLPYGPTSAPNICADLLVLGVSNGEGPGRAAPGDVRAFDLLTGAERWSFRTVPAPGEFGNDTWEGESWRNRGGANAWGGISVDAERELVFCGLGSAAFDFYGGDRKGANLFANCVVALDGRTGVRVWHFQTLHHDLWDHDLPTYPNLVTIERDGRAIDAVAQVTKTGHVFLFERETGAPLHPITEVAVPASDAPGEAAWPTQPVPSAPPALVRTVIHEDDLTTLNEAAHTHALEWYRRLRTGAGYLPPSLEGTLVTPGFHGGATWSGASFDPVSGLLFVNSNELPNVVTLKPAPEGARYRYGITGYHRFLDPEGYPAIEPPWGKLTAVDLAAGTIAWEVTLGEHPELTARGIPQTGTHNFGGTIVTKGGLVFIGGTSDERFHAFDSATGELLWETQLPAGGYATPCTYQVDGKQYVVIAAGGAGKVGTRAGDAFVAFALPD